MSNRRLVDTNVILRHLVRDEEAQAKAAARLFAASDRGDIVIEVLPAVLEECVFVLESYYRHPRSAIAGAMARLITSPGIEVADAPILVDALNRYASTTCHFVDCVIAATASSTATPVATFDDGFQKFPDVQVKID